MIDTDELVAFVRARLDEHEQIALATQTCSCGRCEMPLAWTIDDGDIDPLGVGLRHTVAPGYINPEQGAHIVHNDPARVLRKVAADRRILDELVEKVQDLEEGMLFELGHGQGQDYGYSRLLLRLLALPHDDHPDYRETWRP